MAGNAFLGNSESANSDLLTWVIPGHDADAVRRRAARLREWAAGQAAGDLPGIGISLLRTRDAGWRGAVVGSGPEELSAGLAALTDPLMEAAGGVVAPGRVARRRVVFVCPAQGGQWTGMAGELLAAGGVFAEAIADCEAALAPFVDWSLSEVLRGESDAASLERVDVVQPVLFAVTVSLARLWRSYGVEPDAVVGHSIGEIAAAVVAGGLSLPDGARVMASRARIVAETLSGSGAMVSVGLSDEETRDRLADFGGRLFLAAVNGPRQTVITGGTDAAAEFVARCENEGVWAKRIVVDYASHSPAIEEIRDRVLADLAPIRPRSGDIPLCSAVTGEFLDTAGMDAGYWYRQERSPVRFAAAIECLLDAEMNAFIELSPHPAFLSSIESIADSLGRADRIATVETLRFGRGGPGQFATALARAYCVGVDLPAEALTPAAAPVTLPDSLFDLYGETEGEPDTDSRQSSATGPFVTRLLAAPEWDRDALVLGPLRGSRETRRCRDHARRDRLVPRCGYHFGARCRSCHVARATVMVGRGTSGRYPFGDRDPASERPSRRTGGPVRRRNRGDGAQCRGGVSRPGRRPGP
ncbi:acyltransferase domain-containing protein [Nocardia sp. NPDC051750]|uniref:acyltransferase domain-containing protein n=1 Tax=Nocardia sp. NPDC051750 TaxID=3364325 RepID=UPI0037B7A5F3